MRVITVPLLSIILLLSFYKGLAFQEKNISKADIAFISNEKDTDSIQSFLAQRINIDVDQAELGYKVYLDRGIKEDNDTIQFWANFYLGNIAYSKKKYDLAIQYGNKSVHFGEKLNYGGYIISGLSILGGAYQKKRDRKNALNQYLYMKEVIKKYNLKQYEIDNLVSIGQIRIRLGQNEKALVSLKKGLELLQKPAYKSQKNYHAKYLSTIQGIGVCYYKMNNYDEALNYDYKGLQYAEKHNLKEYIIDFNLNIGEAYIGKKKYNKALSYLTIAKSDILQGNKKNDPDLFTANLHIATCFYAQKKYKEARELLLDNFEHIKENVEVEKIREASDLAKKCGEKLNDTDLQFKYITAYTKIVDSLYQNEMSAQEKLYDHDIENLEEQNQDLISKNTLYIISFLLALIAAIAALIYNLKTKQKNKLLYEELKKERIQEFKLEPEILSVAKKEYITDKKAESLLQKLSALEKTTFYLNIDCNLYNTAKNIETNTTYLSKIINEYKKQSFNDYINELRIKYFRNRLDTDAKFRSYTIKAIAGELGYGSVNTFASAFKKQTGLSHSYYIKKVTTEINISKQQNEGIIS
ncbi:AraC family transcriptional regulator [uncultured Aquimarina sp.]|uniref:AraC family transcriptional regulator n=1 Tax=uncultured Aquimarina sp. TaxID=575652 RepID=UPI00260DC2FA|nr:AraC family transcriptional regulator [uncultured Aquimarina sp.]